MAPVFSLARNRARWLIAAAALLLGFVTFEQRLSAEAPISDPAEFTKLVRKLSGKNVAISDMRNEGLVPDTAAFKEYFDLAIEVIRSPANPNLPKARAQYFRDHLAKAGNAPAKTFHDELNKLLLSKLPLIADDADVKPAGQVNAVMILCDLNSKELAVGGSGTAVPLPAALPVLLNMFRTHKSQAIRATALAGIVRHADSGGMAKDMQSQVVAEMLKTISEIDPPKGRSPDGHLWMRRRATDILGEIGLPGDDSDPAAVAKALAAVITEQGDSRQLPLRCDAGRALSKLKLTPAQNVNYSRLVHSVALLAVDAAADRDASTQRGFRSSMLPVDFLFQGVLIPARRNEPAKRKTTGVVGSASGTPHEEYVKNVWSKVEPLVELSLNAEYSSEEALERAKELQAWLGENPAEGEIVAAN